MSRIITVLCVFSVIFFAACAQPDQTTQQTEQPTPTEQPEAPDEAQGRPEGQTQSETPIPQPGPEASEEMQEIQHLLRTGDFQQAIARLEDMYSEDPSPGVTNLLVQAHANYAIRISEAPDVDEVEANETLYMHLSRILELDPENPEALQHIESVKAWYETHNMPLPDQIEPLYFLESMEEDAAEEPADETAEE